VEEAKDKAREAAGPEARNNKATGQEKEKPQPGLVAHRQDEVRAERE
jgi:hypothetical protein